jgi:hypothetical protein
MTKETLKQLIDIEFERVETISQFKSEVFRLIDLYEQDKPSTPATIVTNEPDEVMYAEICGCNPKNGGSGMCGCVMGNKMVPNPKKYGYPKSNFGTTSGTNIELQDPYSPTAKWITNTI